MHNKSALFLYRTLIILYMYRGRWLIESSIEADINCYSNKKKWSLYDQYESNLQADDQNENGGYNDHQDEHNHRHNDHVNWWPWHRCKTKYTYIILILMSMTLYSLNAETK